MAAPTTSPAIVPTPPPPIADVPYPSLENIQIEDGAPVDGMFSEKQMRLMTEALYSSWSPGEGHTFRVFANVGLFHTYGEPPVVPDVMLSLDAVFGDDLTKKENLSYFVWLRGKLPDVAVEIVSNREGGEADWKLNLYARIRVLYYVIHDPLKLLSDQELRVFGLRDGKYQPISPEWLEGVGLGLKLWPGKYELEEATWLRWCDRAGNVIPTGAEKAEKLADQLRALGIQPAV